MSFDHLHPFVTFTVAITVSLSILYACFWPLSRARVIDRMPFALAVGGIPLEFAVMLMPNALPGFFALVLGHSIYAKESEDAWMWLNKWQGGVAGSFRWLVVVGGMWALVNLLRGRAKILNAVAVIFAGIFLYVSLHMGL